ncbi:uncharacterized protein LOC105703885 isoform X2 [Orussus abietinus]|uniref:uncharacterized protein LOC105703885 isoform X2 n=1 Tax=Orussus abietinus TaxID=222816 RepID=UPI000626ABB0|nr:uncharacterized protein LOC105703885 isoform X2 [Orussus abietinus]
MASDLSSGCTEAIEILDEKEEGEISLDDVSSWEESQLNYAYNLQKAGQCPCCLSWQHCAPWCTLTGNSKKFKRRKRRDAVQEKENRHHTRESGYPGSKHAGSTLQEKNEGLVPISSDSDMDLGDCDDSTDLERMKQTRESLLLRLSKKRKKKKRKRIHGSIGAQNEHVPPSSFVTSSGCFVSAACSPIPAQDDTESLLIPVESSPPHLNECLSKPKVSRSPPRKYKSPIRYQSPIRRPRSPISLTTRSPDPRRITRSLRGTRRSPRRSPIRSPHRRSPIRSPHRRSPIRSQHRRSPVRSPPRKVARNTSPSRGYSNRSHGTVAKLLKKVRHLETVGSQPLSKFKGGKKYGPSLKQKLNIVKESSAAGSETKASEKNSSNNNTNNDADDEEDIALLRKIALETKSQRRTKRNAIPSKSEAEIQPSCVIDLEDSDYEDLELRRIALKSAVLRKREDGVQTEKSYLVELTNLSKHPCSQSFLDSIPIPGEEDKPETPPPPVITTNENNYTEDMDLDTDVEREKERLPYSPTDDVSNEIMVETELLGIQRSDVSFMGADRTPAASNNCSPVYSSINNDRIRLPRKETLSSKDELSLEYFNSMKNLSYLPPMDGPYSPSHPTDTPRIDYYSRNVIQCVTTVQTERISLGTNLVIPSQERPYSPTDTPIYDPELDLSKLKPHEPDLSTPKSSYVPEVTMCSKRLVLEQCALQNAGFQTKSNNQSTRSELYDPELALSHSDMYNVESEAILSPSKSYDPDSFQRSLVNESENNVLPTNDTATSCSVTSNMMANCSESNLDRNNVCGACDKADKSEVSPSLQYASLSPRGSTVSLTSSVASFDFDPDIDPGSLSKGQSSQNVQSSESLDEIARDIERIVQEPLYLKGIHITKDPNKIPTLVNRTLVPVSILKNNKQLQQPLPPKKLEEQKRIEPAFKSADMQPVEIDADLSKSNGNFKPIKLCSFAKKQQFQKSASVALNVPPTEGDPESPRNKNRTQESSEKDVHRLLDAQSNVAIHERIEEGEKTKNLNDKKKRKRSTEEERSKKHSERSRQNSPDEVTRNNVNCNEKGLSSDVSSFHNYCQVREIAGRQSKPDDRTEDNKELRDVPSEKENNKVSLQISDNNKLNDDVGKRKGDSDRNPKEQELAIKSTTDNVKSVAKQIKESINEKGETREGNAANQPSQNMPSFEKSSEKMADSVSTFAQTDKVVLNNRKTIDKSGNSGKNLIDEKPDERARRPSIDEDEEELRALLLASMAKRAKTEVSTSATTKSTATTSSTAISRNAVTTTTVTIPVATVSTVSGAARVSTQSVTTFPTTAASTGTTNVAARATVSSAPEIITKEMNYAAGAYSKTAVATKQGDRGDGKGQKLPANSSASRVASEVRFNSQPGKRVNCPATANTAPQGAVANAPLGALSIGNSVPGSVVPTTKSEGLISARRKPSVFVPKATARKIVKKTPIPASTRVVNNAKRAQKPLVNATLQNVKYESTRSISPKTVFSETNRFIICLNSDSESETETNVPMSNVAVNSDAGGTTKRPPLNIPTSEFEKSVDQFLRDVRKKQESAAASKSPSQGNSVASQKQPSLNTTAQKPQPPTPSASAKLPAISVTPLAVRHLPASQQEEYRRLKQQILEREKQKLQRILDTSSSTTSAQQNNKNNNSPTGPLSPASPGISPPSKQIPPSTVLTNSTLMKDRSIKVTSTAINIGKRQEPEVSGAVSSTPEIPVDKSNPLDKSNNLPRPSINPVAELSKTINPSPGVATSNTEILNNKLPQETVATTDTCGDTDISMQSETTNIIVNSKSLTTKSNDKELNDTVIQESTEKLVDKPNNSLLIPMQSVSVTSEKISISKTVDETLRSTSSESPKPPPELPKTPPETSTKITNKNKLTTLDVPETESRVADMTAVQVPRAETPKMGKGLSILTKDQVNRKFVQIQLKHGCEGRVVTLEDMETSVVNLEEDPVLGSKNCRNVTTSEPVNTANKSKTRSVWMIVNNNEPVNNSVEIVNKDLSSNASVDDEASTLLLPKDGNLPGSNETMDSTASTLVLSRNSRTNSTESPRSSRSASCNSSPGGSKTNSRAKMEDILEKIKADVEKEIKGISQLPFADQERQLLEAEHQLLKKRYMVLDDLTEMSGNLRLWEMERDIQLDLLAEVNKLREQLKVVEERLQMQKKRVSSMGPKVAEAHEKINSGRKECFRLSRLCAGLGQRVCGETYKVPTAGASLLNDKLKEVASHTRPLSRKRIPPSTSNSVSQTLLSNEVRRPEKSIPKESKSNGNTGQKIMSSTNEQKSSVASAQGKSSEVQKQSVNTNVQRNISCKSVQEKLSAISVKNNSNASVRKNLSDNVQITTAEKNLISGVERNSSKNVQSNINIESRNSPNENVSQNVATNVPTDVNEKLNENNISKNKESTIQGNSEDHRTELEQVTTDTSVQFIVSSVQEKSHNGTSSSNEKTPLKQVNVFDKTNSLQEVSSEIRQDIEADRESNSVIEINPSNETSTLAHEINSLKEPTCTKESHLQAVNRIDSAEETCPSSEMNSQKQTDIPNERSSVDNPSSTEQPNSETLEISDSVEVLNPEERPHAAMESISAEQSCAESQQTIVKQSIPVRKSRSMKRMSLAKRRNSIVGENCSKESNSAVQLNSHESVNSLPTDSLTQNASVQIVGPPTSAPRYHHKNRHVRLLEPSQDMPDRSCNHKKSFEPYKSLLTSFRETRKPLPDGILCPYELMGTCRDGDCPFVHHNVSHGQ